MSMTATTIMPGWVGDRRGGVQGLGARVSDSVCHRAWRRVVGGVHAEEVALELDLDLGWSEGASRGSGKGLTLDLFEGACEASCERRRTSAPGVTLSESGNLSLTTASSGLGSLGLPTHALLSTGCRCT